MLMPTDSSHVSRLALDHFRSWESVVLDFAPGVNVLVGRNGIGKTNIVEALEFVAAGSSHRTNSSRTLIARGATHATVRVNLEENLEITSTSEPPTSPRTTTLEATIPTRGAIRSRVNAGPSRYFRDIAGMLKAVVFSPRDQLTVQGDPAARRAFIDQTATMLFADYYDLHQRFQQIGRQRAAVLKQLGKVDDPQMAQLLYPQLETWTSEFINAGIALTVRRREVVRRLSGPFSRIARQLSDDPSPSASAALDYQPSFAEVEDVLGSTDEAEWPAAPDFEVSADNLEKMRQSIAQHFQRLLAGEQARGISLIGPQRDDMSVTLDGEPARDYASNGEMWTLALALRMAQFECLSTSSKPILILDDVFAQLDEERRLRILRFAREQGQVFITVAARSDIPELHDDSTTRIIDVEKLAQKSQLDEQLAAMAAQLSQQRAAQSDGGQTGKTEDTGDGEARGSEARGSEARADEAHEADEAGDTGE